MSRPSHNGILGDIHPLRKLYDGTPDQIQAGIHSVISSLGINAHLALLFDSPLRRRGWFKSYGDKPIDREGNPLPWMAYSFIDFADERLTSEMRVFEYGSGNSTLWFAERVREVVAVEHDQEWYDFIHTQVPTNTTVIYSDEEDYAETISSFDKFDVVIVDGIRRTDCVREALSTLSSRGVIVIDDSHRAKYANAYDLLKSRGFREITFRSMGPYASPLQSTAIYYRDDNCLGI